MTHPARAWLSVVGIGEDGLAALTPAARDAVEGAEVLIGGARHLAMVPDDARERMRWPSPFNALVGEIEARRGRRVCVLASGDPLWFGVGAVLARHFDSESIVFHPGRSSMVIACARLGWPMESVEVVTLHGRAFERLHRYVTPRARLLVLCHGARTPASVADAMVARGFGASRVVVLEHLDGGRERMVEATAQSLAREDFAALAILAVDCVAGADARWFSHVPGLPDEAFEHDGQLTKQAARAVTLAALQPFRGARLWDVGAGCGSVAIEWLRSTQDARAIAIECIDERAERMVRNAANLGVPELDVVTGKAPDALTGLPRPDAVFIGGGLNDQVVDTCWSALAPGGRMVANAVTIEGQSALYALEQQLGGTLTRLGVAQARSLGRFRSFDNARDLVQFVAVKR